jgi:hypothetical protein
MTATDVQTPEVSGGYVLTVDNVRAFETGIEFSTSRGTPPTYGGLQHVYPKEELIAPEQRTWIKSYLDDFETALYGSQYEDSSTGYAAYADEQSFIRYHIIAEALKNPDTYYASMFLHKERNGLLTMGPIWDYNVSLGGRVISRDTTRYLLFQHGLRWGLAFWFDRLLTAKRYRDAWRATWLSLRASALETSGLHADIDTAEALLSEAAARHFALAEANGWFVLGTPMQNFADQIGQNSSNYVARGDNYAEEVDFLRTWTTQRLSWIDAHLDCLEPTSSEYLANSTCTAIVPF